MCSALRLSRSQFSQDYVIGANNVPFLHDLFGVSLTY